MYQSGDGTGRERLFGIAPPRLRDRQAPDRWALLDRRVVWPAFAE